MTWIDNEEVVSSNKIEDKQIGLNKFLTEDYDIWEMTKNTISDSECHINWHCIKGHQDQEKLYEDLPFEAQLNVQVNALAEKAHNLLSIAPVYRSLENLTTIYINEVIASHSNMRSSIQTAVHSDDLLDYMSHKYQWTKKIIDSIDWDLFSYCYSKTKIHKMMNAIKYLHGWQFTKGKEYQQNQQISPLCPMGCGENETQLHYLLCKEPSWTPILKTETVKLKHRLSSLKTAPTIISILLYAMAHN